MSDLVVIVPSRGRPEQAAELAQAFAVTCTANTGLVFAVDDDDPRADGYWDVVQRQLASVIRSNHANMVDALNRRATGYASLGEDAPSAIGFMGDDHRPRTPGWDQAYLDALRDLGTGIVYGNDLLQGERLPTQCAMTSDIIRALGYMSPPTLKHMYVDNFWLGLGRMAGCIQYLPDVVVEHMHPYAGKAEMDAGYTRVNDRTVYAADEAAYLAYCQEQMAIDVAKVTRLRGAHVDA